ncbi:SUMF1/EgtB/PvdO family nonheme iron enzyme [Candidatus Micrarchaeota archaeon]|nr:SUMF1/EgtB/PvdO family nonheme iron enzyme [Candidatus Micrarchaeota archaeon]
MTFLQIRQRQTAGNAARVCAFAALASSLALSCNRKDEGYSESAPDEQKGVPHLIPLKDKGSARDAGGARDAASGKTLNPKPGTGTVSPAPFPPGRGCPEEMARSGSFCIDRYEIHLVSKDGTQYPHFKAPPSRMDNLSARSAPNVFPQGHLSQETAMKACGNAGKRLCTLAEWQAACSGGGSRKFPHGNEPAPGTCNVDKRNPHILDKHFPGVPHMKRAGKHFNDQALLQDPDYLERTGQRPGCVTPEGIFDLDGNLSEWVDDSVQKPDGLHGTFAGDAFSGAGAQGCGRKTDAHAANYYDYSMGTRCCRNPGR